NEGVAKFLVIPGEAKTSSLHIPLDCAGARVIDVKVMTMDGIFADIGWEQVDFLKIDCEGFDLAVLKGGRQMLASSKVSLIQFEYNWMWPKAGYTLAAALQLLESYSYSTYLLRHRKLWQFDYDKW